MAKEQTGIVLGKLAPPFKKGFVYFNGWGGFVPLAEAESRFKRNMANFDRRSCDHYSNDPDYFAAERKRKRRRV